MRHLKHIWVALLAVFLINSCTNDSSEELISEWEYRDSLKNKIPSINIITPANGDTVTIPFAIEYELDNWIVSEGGNHVACFLDGTQTDESYHPTSLIVSNIDTGFHSFTLQLVKATGELVQVLGEIDLWTQLPAPDTYQLIVSGGNGSGNYAVGDSVLVEAHTPAVDYQFAFWGGDSTFVLNPKNKQDTIVMPDHDISINAEYEPIPISYTKDIRPIFEANCIECHSARYDYPKFNSCEDIKAVADPLLWKIEDERTPMPPSGLMPQESIDTIKKWLEEGAKCE